MANICLQIHAGKKKHIKYVQSKTNTDLKTQQQLQLRAMFYVQVDILIVNLINFLIFV